MNKHKDLIDRLRTSHDKTDLEFIKEQVNMRLVELKEKENEINEKEKSLTENSLNNEVTTGKKIEFYSQSYAAFVNTKLEKDKSLLTLSVAGLGFIVTKFPSSEKSTLFQYIFFSCCALCFWSVSYIY